MSQPINFRRGSTADRILTTLGAGEPGWDTNTLSLYMGDGTTVGGIKVGGAPITMDFTIYVATSTYGGTAGGSGLQLASGTASSTVANKLVDSSASFSSAKHLNKTVYNITAVSWAKITAVDSATQLSLSANIMSGGDAYVIVDAVSTVSGAWDKIPTPFYANVTILFSNETHTGNAELVGKIPAGDYTITLKNTSLTCTLSGNIVVRQRVSIGSSSSALQFSGKIETYSGAEVSWISCKTTGKGKIYTYGTASNTFTNCTGGITIGNDPTNIISINSTITKGYTIYVATTALGGDDAVADGLAITNGTATATIANKLVDSGAAFTSALVGKAVWNSTDDTWAKVTAVDSATQLSLSVDIMASGEAYVIANAFSTIQGGINAIPGTVNCDTSIKVSNGTFIEQVTVQGKQPSGAYTLTISGVMSLTDSGTCTSATDYSSGTQSVFNDTGKSWTINAHANKILRLTGGTGYDSINTWKNDYIIESNTATQLTLIGKYFGIPVSGTTYKIMDFATLMDGNSHTINTAFDVVGAQIEVTLKFFKGQNYYDTHFFVRNGATVSVFTLYSVITASASSEARGMKYEQGARCPNANCVRVDGASSMAVTFLFGAQTLYNATTSKFGLTNSLLKANYIAVEVSFNSVLGYCAGYGNKLITILGYETGLLSSVGSTADIFNFIINPGSGAGGNGVRALEGSIIRIRGGNDIFGATSHGIYCDSNSSVWAVVSGSKSRNNGGWGMSTSLSSVGKSITTNITYTANTSGSYTADASSINT